MTDAVLKITEKLLGVGTMKVHLVVGGDQRWCKTIAKRQVCSIRLPDTSRFGVNGLGEVHHLLHVEFRGGVFCDGGLFLEFEGIQRRVSC